MGTSINITTKIEQNSTASLLQFSTLYGCRVAFISDDHRTIIFEPRKYVQLAEEPRKSKSLVKIIGKTRKDKNSTKKKYVKTNASDLRLTLPNPIDPSLVVGSIGLRVHQIKFNTAERSMILTLRHPKIVGVRRPLDKKVWVYCGDDPIMLSSMP